LNKRLIIGLIFLANFHTISFGENLVNPTIFGVENRDWPDFNLYLFAENALELTPHDIKQWKIEVKWDENECEVLNEGQFNLIVNQESDIIMVVDNSSSMKGKIHHVRQAIKIFLEGLRKDSHVGVICFQEHLFDELYFQEHLLGQLWHTEILIPITDSFYYLKKKNYFRNLTNKTYLNDACFHALTYFDGFTEEGQKSIVVLTDGEDVGSRTRYKSLQKRAADSGIPFYFIDFSEGAVRSSSGRNIAKQSKGQFAASDNPTELSDIYFDMLTKINRQLKFKCRFKGSNLEVPSRGTISIAIYDENSIIRAKTDLTISLERRQFITFRRQLSLVDTLKLESKKSIKKTYGSYRDEVYYLLAKESIKRDEDTITNEIIRYFNNSKSMFSLERSNLLRIKRAETTNAIDINDYYKEFLLQHPNSIAADEQLWKLIQWNKSNEFPDTALSLCRELVQVYPWSRYSDDCLIELAFADCERGNYNEAEILLQTIGQQYRESDKYGQSILQLAELYTKQGELEKAEQLLLNHKEQYLSLEIGDQLYYQLALTQSLMKKNLLAAETLDELLILLPGSSYEDQALLLQANICWKNLYMPEKASLLLKTLLEKAEVDGVILRQAEIQFNELTLSKTPEYQLKVLEREPNDPLLLQIMSDKQWETSKDLPNKFLTMATEMVNEGKLEQALLITKSVYKDYQVLGISDRALYHSAQVYSEMGDMEKQAETLRKLLEQYPLSTFAIPALMNLASCYEQMNNQKAALDVYQDLLLRKDDLTMEYSIIEEEYLTLKEKAKVIVDGTLQGIPAELNKSVKITAYQLPSLEVFAECCPDSDGKFKLDLPLGKQYTLTANLSGYLPATLNLDYRNVITAANIEETLDLVMIKKGSKITLQNVLFDFSSSELRPESIPTLNEAVKFFKDNQDLRVEISGHTDNIGDEDFNQQLSMNRALRVSRYLKEHEVPLKNIVIKGYGSKIPISDNITEEGRALNRRVEMKIL